MSVLNLRRRAPRCAAVTAAGVCLVALCGVAAQTARGASPSSWPSGGHDVSNTHSNPAETKINPQSVGLLAVKWSAQVHGDVSAVPAVVDGAVYVPDWGGYLNKLNAATGAVMWSRPISDYTAVPNDAARAAPAVVGNDLFIGDQGSQFAGPAGSSMGGGFLSKINATTGNLIWSTKVDSHPFAILTAGPLVYNGVVYQGVASTEEGAAADGNYPCCTFRGSIVAVDALTGGILWKTYTVPDNGGVPCATQNPPTGCGYSGNGVWGTTPALDPANNTLFVTTGNNYTVPDDVKACEPNDCSSPNDHFDSIMALDASTGHVKWSTGLKQFDDWNVACIPGFGSPNNCPLNPGPDYDFGSGPNLFTTTVNGKKKLVVGAGEKSGEYWALDAATGAVLWGQAAGPGSTLGGIEWGPATDGKRIYVAEENFNGIPYQLPSGQTTTAGSWAAIDPSTGAIVWQVADPSHNAFGGGNALGPVSVENGVLFTPSMSGDFYALDAANGKTLWHFRPGGAAVSGAVVVNGVVYWGDGYSHLFLPGWLPSTTFYAFSVNGN